MGCLKLTYHQSTEPKLISSKKVLTSKKSVLKARSYFLFGLKHKGYNNVVSSNGNSVAQKFKYNGKEIDEDLGLNLYDYEARNYQADLGRFMQIDPLAEISQRQFSPYHYVKNNPVKFVDPDGMIWKDQEEADRFIEKVKNRLKSVTGKIAKLQYKLDNGDLSDKKKAKLKKRIDGLTSRTESLKGTISDVVALGADKDHVFDLVSNSGDTNHVKEGKDGVISIQGSTDALHVHEIKHVALALKSRNGLKFNSQNLLKPVSGNGLKDEILGYRAQYGYEPSSLPGSVSNMSGIDLKYIGNLRKDDGTLVYPIINRIWKQKQKRIKNSKKQKKQNKN
ncbi:MAG: hypothetical protein GKR88_01420 [Flavobacteriaceae bacterium]|nr:MAG: hypothetical protein GKR88_01420 [Flavobacteriaceae bacterium]